eukprot:COSAG01_NODE_39617_length_474_cov_0.960000_2_plen_98_part_00
MKQSDQHRLPDSQTYLSLLLCHQDTGRVQIRLLGCWRQVFHELGMRHVACQHVAMIGRCLVPVHSRAALDSVARQLTRLLRLPLANNVVVGKVPTSA